MKCEMCKGTGRQILKTTEVHIDKPNDVSEMEITCVVCEGSGAMTQEDKDWLEFERHMWCECKEPSEDLNFYDDGEHPEIHKHHYRCQKCDKVTQIG